MQEKVLYGKLKVDVSDIISTLCKYKGVEITDGVVFENHIHLSILIPLKYSVLRELKRQEYVNDI